MNGCGRERFDTTGERRVSKEMRWMNGCERERFDGTGERRMSKEIECP